MTATAHTSDGEGAIEAVILDMDGVVTDTARLHFEAWKATFDAALAGAAGAGAPAEATAPFTREDYLEHVDGVPRADGIARFLAARGLDLPEGAPDDRSLATQSGIAARKNERFRALLESGVDVFPDAVAFLSACRRAGVATGLFTASRNAEAVLSAAGLLGLFDARVDGIVARAGHLPGKPDPAILLETARRLGAAPARTAVVEDAEAGVAAGAAGGFLPVIGLDRTVEGGGHGLRLRAGGADIVAPDLSPFLTEDGELKRPATLPPALSAGEAIAARAAGRPLAVFLSVDGLLPPDGALAPETRAALTGLARVARVAVISGRDLVDLGERVGVPGIAAAGSDGFDIALADGTLARPAGGAPVLAALATAEERLRAEAADLAGVAVERHAFSLDVATADAPAEAAAAAEGAVERVAAEAPRLSPVHGRLGPGLRPATDWHRGRAADWLLTETAIGDGDPLAIAIGGTVADEDLFLAVRARGGIAVAVRGPAGLTTADHALGRGDEVARFLTLLAGIAGDRNDCIGG